MAETDSRPPNAILPFSLTAGPSFCLGRQCAQLTRFHFPDSLATRDGHVMQANEI